YLLATHRSRSRVGIAAGQHLHPRQARRRWHAVALQLLIQLALKSLATAVPVIHQPILGVTGPGILPGRRRYTAGDPLLHLTRPLAIQRRQTDNRLFIPRLSLTDRAEFPPA